MLLREECHAGENPLSEVYVINHVAAINLVPGSTDYRLMKRSVVKAIVSMTERERFTKGIYSWVGFKNKWIEYENVERVAGNSKWSFMGLLRYAYSGFIAFATTPLRGVVYFGMLIVLASVVGAIHIFIGALNTPSVLRNGYATLMIVILFLGGVIIKILGMIVETNIGHETAEEMINGDKESEKWED